MELERIGQEPASGRDVFLAFVSNLEDLPSQITLPCPRFVLLLAHDASDKPATLDTVLEQLLDIGCAYLCAWGPGCEYTHDLMDETILGKELGGAAVPNIMTTWHSSASLAEATDFALRCALPDEDCASGCHAIVLAVVGNDEWLKDLRAVASGWVSSAGGCERQER